MDLSKIKIKLALGVFLEIPIVLFKVPSLVNFFVLSAIDVELLAVNQALRIAWVRRWTQIWLKTDSTLVVRYLHSLTWSLGGSVSLS